MASRLLEEFPIYKQDGTNESKLPWLEFVVIFTALIYILETYLDMRQYRCLCADAPPKLLLDAVKKAGKDFESKVKDKFSKAQAYGRAKATFGLASRLFNEIIGMGLLLLGFGAWAWDLSEDIVGVVGYESDHVIARSVCMLGIQHYLMLPISIPFDLYSQFVIEEKFGFNKQTISLFVMDRIKGEVLTVVIGVPFLVALLLIIDWGGEHFYLYVCARQSQYIRTSSSLRTHSYVLVRQNRGRVHVCFLVDHVVRIPKLYSTVFQQGRAARRRKTSRRYRIVGR